MPDQEAMVTRVVDGDTIEVQLADGSTHRVRYIGIDTPETVAPGRPVQCGGPEASARNRDLVLGQTVWLERDTSDTDRFGRLVRYVWLGDTLVETTLLAEGYARAYPYRPDTRRADEFAAVEAIAHGAGLGMWGLCAARSGASDLGEDSAPVPTTLSPPEPTPTSLALPAPAAPSAPGLRPGFNPAQYLGQGDRYNCTDFRTQIERVPKAEL